MEPKKNIQDAFLYGKIPPQSIDLEEQIIGMLMTDDESFHSIISILSSEKYFYKKEHQIIYRTIIDLKNKGNNTDLIIVTNKLREIGKLDEIGGILNLTSFTVKVSYNLDIELSCKIIAEKYVKRETIRVCSEIINQCYDEINDIDEILTNLKRSSEELESNFDSVDNGSETLEVAKDTLNEIFSDVEKYKKGISSGINTGFSDLNRMIGGFKPATLLILASRPSIGKTSLALHFAYNAAIKDKYVNLFSFEMTKTQLFKILIASESGIDRTNIRDGKLTDDELSIINRKTGNIDRLPILWNTRPMNVFQIKSVIRKNISHNKCDIVIIDYLQLIKASDTKMVREQQISEISRELKLMTIEFGIPIICLSQLNRLAETEVPQLRHLRESGAIEQDADNVIFPYKEVDSDMNEISYSLIVAKSRNGSTGIFEIWHNTQMTKFGNKGDENKFQQFNYNPNQQIEPNYNFGNDLKGNDVPF